MITFTLVPHLYAARYENSIIILDSVQDKYLSVIDDAAKYLAFILDASFISGSEFVPAGDAVEIDIHQLNAWIQHFSDKKIIMQSLQDGISRRLAAHPLKPGGLIEYKWDHKPSWKPFARAKKSEILKTVFVLAKVHRALKRQGIKGVLDLIGAAYNKQISYKNPTESELEVLAATVDVATMLYPKKTFCLAWAATFVLLALKKQWQCKLEIGVQTNPFYAHAWVTSSDKVIHDDPMIAQVLSIILKEPRNN